MKNLPILILGGLLWLASGASLAHTGLEESSPADGATLQTPPRTLDLVFTEDVSLLMLSVRASDGSEVETDFRPTATPASQFSVSLPALGLGGYTVNWTILGADSHRVEGEFSFTVGASIDGE